MDGIVATQNYVTLTNGLTAAGVPFAARLEPYRHCRILSSNPKTRPWLYNLLFLLSTLYTHHAARGYNIVHEELYHNPSADG